jgi:hypothetical protein
MGTPGFKGQCGQEHIVTLLAKHFSVARQQLDKQVSATRNT